MISACDAASTLSCTNRSRLGGEHLFGQFGEFRFGDGYVPLRQLSTSLKRISGALWLIVLPRKTRSQCEAYIAGADYGNVANGY